MVEDDQRPHSTGSDIGQCGTGVSPVKPSASVDGQMLKADNGPKIGFRTFGHGKMGILDRLCVIMSPGKTISKLRSAPAPYLAQTPAPKLGVGIDFNRCRDRVSCLLGPDLTEVRTVSHRDGGSASVRCRVEAGRGAIDTLKLRRRPTLCLPVCELGPTRGSEPPVRRMLHGVKRTKRLRTSDPARKSIMSKSLVAIRQVGLKDSLSPRPNACLGISYCRNKFFSKSRVRDYVLWCAGHFPRLLIIVPDHLEAYNFHVYKRIPFSTALKRAQHHGRNLQRAFSKSIPSSMTSRTLVLRASELLSDPECGRLLRIVREIDSEDVAFSSAVTRDVWLSTRGRLHEAGVADDQATSSRAALRNYLLEEIAIVLFVAHCSRPTYPVMIGPCAPHRTITELYEGRFSAGFRTITQSHPFRFVELVDPHFIDARTSGPIHEPCSED